MNAANLESMIDLLSQNNYIPILITIISTSVRRSACAVVDLYSLSTRDITDTCLGKNMLSMNIKEEIKHFSSPDFTYVDCNYPA